MDALSKFLSHEAKIDWQWGKCDCLLFMADWVLVQSGRDPALPWRGRYQSRRGAGRTILRAGGIENLVEQGLTGLGWLRTSTPRRGDIGLVRAPIISARGGMKIGKLGAVCLAPKLWAVKPSDRKGMAAADFEPLAIWSPHG